MNDDFKNYIQLLIDNKDKIIHLPEKDIHNLLDYITNLQQELEEEKRINQEDLKYIDELNERIEKLEKELKQWKKKYGK